MTYTTDILHIALGWTFPPQTDLELEGLAGDFADDFDLEGAREDYIEAMDAAAKSVRPDLDFDWDSNEIYRDIDMPPLSSEEAEEIDDAIGDIDYGAILDKNDKSHHPYATREEAIEREIISLIEEINYFADAREDYDIDAIADELIVSEMRGPNPVYYRVGGISRTNFQEIIDAHAITL